MASPGLLVIGASQWKHAFSRLRKFDGFDVSIISVSGMRVEEVDSSMLLATEFFDDVVIHLGTNNLICGQSPDEVVNHQERLLTDIRDRNSNVRLYLSGVLKRATKRFDRKPPSEWESRRIVKMNRKIDHLNNLMRQLCQRMNAVYIDNWEAFEAADVDPYLHLLSRDGLHLTPAGVECLLGNVICISLRTRRSYFHLPLIPSASPTYQPPPPFLSSISTPSTLIPSASPTYQPPPPPLSSISTPSTLISSASPTYQPPPPFLSSISTPSTLIPSASPTYQPPPPPLSSISTPSTLISSASPNYQPFPSSGGLGTNASTSSLAIDSSFPLAFSYRDALLSNLSQFSSPLDHNTNPMISVSPPVSIPLNQNSGVSALPQLSPSTSSSSNSQFISLNKRGKHQWRKAKHSVSYQNASTFTIPLFNRWSALSSVNEVEVPSPLPLESHSSIKFCYKKAKVNAHKNSSTTKHFKSYPQRYHLSKKSQHPMVTELPFKTLSCPSVKSRPSSVLSFPPPLPLIPENCFKLHGKFIRPDTSGLLRYNCMDTLSVKKQNGGSLEDAKKLSIYPRKCNTCEKLYATKSSFSHHKATCKKTESKDAISYPRVCPTCHVSYSNKCNYSRHKKNCNESSQYIKCPHDGCGIKFQSHSVMISHLQSSHQEDICVEEYEFKDLSEFYAWKSNQCQRNNMSLVKHNGEHVSHGSKFLYYICKFNNHHKNDIVCNKTNRRRKYGRMPNSDCIARMLVKANESGVSVRYVNSHNHELEFQNVKYYRWSQETKFQINSLLEQSVPALKIQEYFQPADVSFQAVLPLKEHFITSTQINKMKYELASKKHLNDDDAIAVHILATTMSAESEDSILVYKPMGSNTVIGDKALDTLPHASELFVLGIQQKHQVTEMIAGCSRILCIDSTHGTNQYKFHLLNLIVPDEYGVGYPVANFIISHLDEETLTYLLQSVKNRAPDLYVNAVMTDGDEALGNAVRRVFGEKTKHLLCKWHVKRNWRKNLQQKVRNNELAIEINDILETLIEEKSDSVFNSMLNSFLAKYIDSAPAFIKYFQDYYCTKKEKWAMCYRNFPHAGTDTNMFVESYHNQLKSHYLNRKVNKRLDDLIQVLQTIQKNIHLRLTYKRMIKVPTLGFQGIHLNDHIKGIRIADEDVLLTSDENVWHVSSQKNSSVFYVVTSISQKCLIPHLCFIRCNEFSCLDLCCHLYQCSCPNRYTLCKHVHKVHSFVIRNSCTTVPTYDPNLSSPPKKNVRSVNIPKVNQEEPPKEQTIKCIGKLLDKLKILSQQCTPTLLPYICKSLKLLVDKCEGSVECEESNFTPVISKPQEIPPNAKLSTQLRLYQTIKNRRPMVNRLTKPSIARRREIKKALLSKENDYLMQPVGDMNPLMDVCKVGSYSVKMYELQSLNYNISEEDVHKIRVVVPDFQKGWLYDTVIAAFLWKIAAADTATEAVDPVISQSVTGSTSLEQAMAFLGKIDSLRNTKVIIPLNISNSHWMLIVAWPRERRVDFYDPAADGVMQAYRNAIQRWIQVLSVKFGCGESDWKILAPQHSRQRDGYNCGVFISWYSERVIQGKSTAEKFDPGMYRKYMFRIITESNE